MSYPSPSSLITNSGYPKSSIPALITLIAAGMISSALSSEITSNPYQEQFDQVWAYSSLYKNEQNPILQEFKLRGRYQGQYHALDSNRGSDEGWEDRRSRIGFDAKLLEKRLELRAEFQSNDGFEDAYDRLVDAYIRWKPTSQLSITAGKIKPLIGYYDWIQSSTSQPTFERSQIFNQLGVDRATSLTIEGKHDDVSWQTGIYSNDMDREFGTFGGSISFGAGIGYDARKSLGWDRADFHLDWLQSDHDADDRVFLNYDTLISATFWGAQGPWNLVVEGFTGLESTTGSGDVFGFYIQPTYDLIPSTLQLVGRYAFSAGDGGASLNGQRRYERSAPDLFPPGSAKGDEYHAFYLGAQYFIYGDKLKLMAGAEYSTLSGGAPADDFEGVTFLTGIRMYF
jgi:phosphate-selective porin OprO and OprP